MPQHYARILGDNFGTVSTESEWGGDLEDHLIDSQADNIEKQLTAKDPRTRRAGLFQILRLQKAFGGDHDGGAGSVLSRLIARGHKISLTPPEDE